MPIDSDVSPTSAAIYTDAKALVPTHLVLQVLAPYVRFYTQVIFVISPTGIFHIVVANDISTKGSDGYTSVASKPVRSSSPVAGSQQPLDAASSFSFEVELKMASFVVPS